MASATTFPKRKLTAEQKRVWKSSPQYLLGVQKAQGREQRRLEKALKNTAATEAERIRANDRMAALEKEMQATKKALSALEKKSA